MKQERLDNVQILRGIAAVSVIIGHSFDQFFNHPIAGMSPFGTPIGAVWANGVDIFFIISGFIMYYLSHAHFGERGYSAEFLRRRFIRVVPTYWLFTTMMVVASVAHPGAVNNGLGGAWHVVSSYIFIPSPRPDGLMHPVLGLGWTLNYEMFFYACYALALLAPPKWGLRLLIAAFLLFSIAHPYLPEGILAFWSDPIILEFVAGVLVAVVFVKGIRIDRPFVAPLLFLAGVALAIILPNFVPESVRLLRSGLPSLLMAVALILAPNRRWWGGFVLIGDASYALYLSHPFTLNVVTGVWSKLHLPPVGAIYWLGLVCGSLVTGAIIYIAVEKPIVTFLRRRFEPRREVLAA